MAAARIALLGYGHLAQQLPALMPAHSFYGVKRNITSLPDRFCGAQAAGVKSANVEYVALDLNADVREIQQALAQMGKLDAVVYTATPASRDPVNYRQIYCDAPRKVMQALKALDWRPHWLHVSSTGVFSHKAGQWVHENTEPAPQSEIAQILRASELVVENEYVKGVFLRFGGLYGQGKTHLLQSLKAGRRVQNEPWAYTNRIHRLDAARAIAFVLENALKEQPEIVEVYHGVDYDPAPIHQVRSTCQSFMV